MTSGDRNAANRYCDRESGGTVGRGYSEALPTTPVSIERGRRSGRGGWGEVEKERVGKGGEGESERGEGREGK